MTTTIQHSTSLRFVIEPDFLLYNKTAQRLYHEVAKELPIIDPHNHVDAAALAQNKKFDKSLSKIDGYIALM